MKNKSKKIIITVAAVLVILIAALCIGAGNYLISYAIGRTGDGGNRQVSLDVAEFSGVEKIVAENRVLQKERTIAFVANNEIKETSIKSDDNLNLKGWYAEKEDCNNWVITIHGYRGNHTGMVAYAEHFYELGFNVLCPDLRSCGESEGNYVGMGWLDRKDILLWINWILSRNPNSKIVIHGVSMGGATTMMVSGEETPANVVAFVEDCGYTSVWDIFASEMKLRFHLPSFPFMNSANAFSKIRAGYSFKEASSFEQVKKCEKPMLFIHGSEDGFVPYDMLQKLYDVKPGTNKKMVSAEGAGHGDAMYLLWDDYWKEVASFITPFLQ